MVRINHRIMQLLVLREVLVHRIAWNKQCRNDSRISGRMLLTEKCLLLHKLSRCNTFQFLSTEAVFNIMLNRWNKINNCSESCGLTSSVITHARILKQLDSGIETCMW